MQLPHPFVGSSHKLFIYNYDEHFVKAVDHFHDNIGRIIHRHRYIGDMEPHVYFETNLLVELLIDKLRGLQEHEEVVTEGIFEDFEEEMAHDLIEELTNWINMELYPFGLRQIIRDIHEECYLIDVTFDKDSDGTYYSFDTAE
jgi:hypothetical protein